MKKVLLTFLFVPIIGLSQERYHQSLTKFDKELRWFMVLKDTNEPISGIVFRGKKYIQHEYTVIDGEVVSCVGYYKNGNIEHESSFSKEGFYDGDEFLFMIYNEFHKKYWRDGSLMSEGNLKDNFKDGLWKYYKSKWFQSPLFMGTGKVFKVIYEKGKVNKKRTRELNRSSK